MNYDLYVNTNVQGPSYFNKNKLVNREFLYCTVRGFTTCRQCDSLQLFTSPRRVWQEYGNISIGRLGLSSIKSLTYRILINQLTFIKHLTNKSINYFTLLWTDWTHEPGKLLLTTK